ncbi:MAG: triose-phosphate isomerase [Chloroflexi bacterium]|nr:triose-phosphate isomerase [Chloroflexota bacterium]
MRIPIIAGNWKMNCTAGEGVRLVREMLPGMENIKGVEKVVCPPFISLFPLKELVKDSSVKLGAQDVYFQEKGAFTGEISPSMLKELCQYVIIGHSERRAYFGETDEIVNKKVQAALKAGLNPIMCVGETLEVRERGKAEELVSGQVRQGLAGMKATDGGALVIAYEPVWAIGTGRAATGDDAGRMIGLIRRTVAGVFGPAAAENVRIQYGGSVTAANIGEFINRAEIDGALVGGASLKADEFVSILEQTQKAKQSSPPLEKGD